MITIIQEYTIIDYKQMTRFTIERLLTLHATALFASTFAASELSAWLLYIVRV